MNTNYLKKLEFDKIKKILSTFACTYIGKDHCLKLIPSNKKSEVQQNLEETQEAVNIIKRNSTPTFNEIDDISIIIKMLESNNSLSINYILSLANIFKLSKKLKLYFDKDFINENDFPILYKIFSSLYFNNDVLNKIYTSILDENTIDDKASKELFSIRKEEKQIEQEIKNTLNKIIHSSKYSKYIQENIVTIRNDRFVIPVKEEYRSQIKGFIHDISNAGSTVFIEPISIFEMNNKLSQIKIKEALEIEKILKQLSLLFLPHIDKLNSDVELIGKLDFIFAKAKFSQSIDGITPLINNNKEINLIDARHPLIDKNNVVPISVNIGTYFSTLLITGPNTGGKTVTLKTIGLLTCMACSGLNIPANEKSSIYVFENIFADIGDDQSISDSLSTFSSHMTNIIDIINTVNENSLVLIDELGSGTDPVEGANLAISILDYLKNTNCITIVTTHYQELKQYALIHNRI